MVDEEAKKTARKILKNELEASELMVEMGQQYDINTVNEAFSEVVSDLVEKVEDEQRLASIYQLLYVLGQQLGSESMAREGAERYNELVGEHDGN